MNLTPQQVARKIAAAASDKKARDILLLNMENLSPLTDYFIIASADNVTLVKAVADNIEEKLAEEGIEIRVIDMHTIKPLDKEIIIKAAKETGAIVTAEEHSVIGGLGSAVAEVTAQECPVKMAMVGQQDTFGESGKPEELKAKYGMTAADIEKAVKKLV